MRIKCIMLLFMAGLFCSKLFAQDIITKTTGDEITAKITKVGDVDIEYRKFDQADGPVYTIPKTDVFMIKYSDGTKDVFNSQPANNNNGNNNGNANNNGNGYNNNARPDQVQPGQNNGIPPSGAPASYQTFYDNLAPYGQWIEHPVHGYVWIPNVAPGFVPYSTNGNWVSTEYGWTWASNYEWGWATFHYGRWDYDATYGWLWVPGNVWSPAWVTWRRSPGYYGWAPLGPGIEVNTALGTTYVVPAERWTFLQERYMGYPSIYEYYAPYSSNIEIYGRSTLINHTYVDRVGGYTYISGPEVVEVQRISGRPVTRVEIVERSTPGHAYSNGGMSIYRPRVEVRRDVVVRPTAVVRMNEVRPLHEREEHYRATHVEERHEERREERHDAVKREERHDANENHNARENREREHAVENRNATTEHPAPAPRENSGSSPRTGGTTTQPRNSNTTTGRQNNNKTKTTTTPARKPTGSTGKSSTGGK